ncbi:chymotrypsin-like elastase family member 2A [Rhinatrema bivittatum]|uniref:chymotrypsin-like elastase family member 2A n=1 Tax=Rhinatrema bivittatum TaxID=194408 RepID=UPI00112CBEAA|nr:chymotrypsin-like elastase family member 2A [Rhinatrema bivittatum]
MLGKFCGYGNPKPLVSVGNKLTVFFASKSKTKDEGFKVFYEAIDPMKTSDKVLKISEFPVGDIPCPPITATPQITTQPGWNQQAIIPQKPTRSMLAGWFGADPFSGTKFPPVITSQGNQLTVRFHTDLFSKGKRHRAYWTTKQLSSAPTEALPQTTPWDDVQIDWPTQCGRPAIHPQISQRIVNGHPAAPGSWPWQVSMQVWPGTGKEMVFLHTCGGTLIHKSWVLTAAHCFTGFADQLYRWRMCLGKHNLTYVEATQQCFNVTGIYRHEKFAYPESNSLEFDIALVKLDGEVVTNSVISFACLPPLDQVLKEGYQCYATGWGDETGNSLNPKVSKGLNQVDLPIIPFETCKRNDYWGLQVKNSMICAGYTRPDVLKSACQGDSGGPFVCPSTADKTIWEVHGITSFGIFGCIVNKKPSVFTRSSAYIPWIEQVIKKDIHNLHNGANKTTPKNCGQIVLNFVYFLCMPVHLWTYILFRWG